MFAEAEPPVTIIKNYWILLALNTAERQYRLYTQSISGLQVGLGQLLLDHEDFHEADELNSQRHKSTIN